MDAAELEELKKISKEVIRQVTGGANKKPSLPCSVCGEVFDGLLALGEHYKTVHPEVWAEWHPD